MLSEVKSISFKFFLQRRILFASLSFENLTVTYLGSSLSNHLLSQLFQNSNYGDICSLVHSWREINFGSIILVVEMNFSSFNFNSRWKLFLSLPTASYMMKMHCSWCITTPGYTTQSRKFETFINIH